MVSYIKDRNLKTALVMAGYFFTLPALALQSVDNDLSLGPIGNLPANIIFQIGGFSISQGRSQNVGIQDLVGDHFTVTDHRDQEFLTGLGYFIKGPNSGRITWMYGLNGFYLLQTSVKGNVIQENLFTNLSYRYSVKNYPIYVAAKALIKSNSDKYNFTVDLGVGPNIMMTRCFSETSLDGGITVPDSAFKGQTNFIFSSTIGFGVRFNHVLGHLPLEIGYRFFYLGEGHLKKETNQLTNNLTTGNSYANALVITLST